MASSSKGKAKISSPQRFNDYLDSIRDEFGSNATSTSFNTYLGGLRVEFELMALEIESLEKDRDKYKEEVEIQAKELENIRRGNICEQCSNGTISAPPLTRSQDRSKRTLSSLFSRPFFQFKTSDKLTTLHTLPDVELPQETPTRRNATQRPTLIIRPHTTIAFSQPSYTLSRSPDVLSSSFFQQPSDSIVDADLPPNESDRLIVFNNEAEKQLDMEIAQKLSHKDRIKCVKFSRDGTYLAAGCADGKVYIYYVQTGTLACALRNLLAEDVVINAVCFSCDGKYLATGSSDGHIYIWEIKTKHVRNAFKGHTRWVWSLDFSSNRQLIVSASSDHTVQLWNMRYGAMKALTDEEPLFLDEPCYTCAVFSPDGKYVAASHRDGIVRIWGVQTGRLIKRLMMHDNTSDFIYGVACMPDGNGLVGGGRDKTLQYWDIRSLYTAQFHRRSQSSGVEENQAERVFSGHANTISSLTISPDGRWIASGSRDQTVRIWDTRSAAMQCTLNHEDKITTVHFSPAGSYLASGSRNGVVRIWRYSNSALGSNLS